ncbi:hypothetical protein K445DRAFT_319698 [Daldinia sp. EC12]|nr:hypothetical protein K445DRAFT_319698 [Daldinia sp. EC12]
MVGGIRRKHYYLMYGRTNESYGGGKVFINCISVGEGGCIFPGIYLIFFFGTKTGNGVGVLCALEVLNVR